MQLENDKRQIITFHMLTQRGLENNEMFLLKKSKTCKRKHIYVNVPFVEGSTQVRYKLDFTPMVLCVPLPSSDTVVLPPKLYVTP
jgi:hypothetical protein